MVKLKKSSKQIQIDKASAFIVIMVSVASIITAFSLVGVKSLLSQRSYQSRVIAQQETALKVAKADVASVDALKASFTSFDGAGTNIIGGNSQGTGNQDGTNAKIVLDSLPSQYDFPALVSSLEKLVNNKGLKISALSGTDDASQSDAVSSTSPVPVPIPFTLGVNGGYQPVEELVSSIEKTVRPINIVSMQLTGTDTAIQLSVSAKTYYQPAKNLNVTTKVVK